MTDYDVFTALLDLFGVQWDSWWNADVGPGSAEVVYGHRPLNWKCTFRGRRPTELRIGGEVVAL